MPGWVLTRKQLDMWATEEDLQAHMGRMCLKEHLKPQDIVSPCLFLASSASAGMTGQALVVDGGKVLDHVAVKGVAVLDQQALALVRQAGYESPFYSVDISTPVWPAEPVRYSFVAASGYVFVDIASSVVTTEAMTSRSESLSALATLPSTVSSSSPPSSWGPRCFRCPGPRCPEST